MTDAQLNRLEAYIASKQTQPWLKGLWSEGMVEWTQGRLAVDDIDHVALPEDVANWYGYAVGKPGYDFRLGYLPPLPFMLDLILSEGRRKVFQEVEDLGVEPSSLSYLVRLTDFSPSHIEELVSQYLRVEGERGYYGERPGDREVLQALLANPNADPEWLEGVFERRLEEAKNGNLNANSWDVFTALAWNPSITPDLADRLAGTDLVTQTEPVLSSLVWNPVFTQDLYDKHFSEGVIYPDLPAETSRRPLLWHGNVYQYKTADLPVLGGDDDAPEGTVELGSQESVAIKDAYKLNSLVSRWERNLTPWGEVPKVSKLTPFELLAMAQPSDSVFAMDVMYLDPSQEKYRLESSEALKGPSAYYPMDVFQFLTAVNIHHVIPLTRLREEFGEDAKDVPPEWLEELI